MTYKFRRSYVDERNRGFLKDSDVPSDFSPEKIEALVSCDLLYSIEEPSEFMKGVDGNTDVENLDPEKRVKGKKG